MTTAQCLKACRKLSKDHGYIVTEQAHACRHNDGKVSITIVRRISVFLGGDIVHMSGDKPTHEAAIADVRAYFTNLNTEQP